LAAGANEKSTSRMVPRSALTALFKPCAFLSEIRHAS